MTEEEILEQNKYPSCKSSNVGFNSQSINGKFVSIGSCFDCRNCGMIWLIVNNWRKKNK